MNVGVEEVMGGWREVTVGMVVEMKWFGGGRNYESCSCCLCGGCVVWCCCVLFFWGCS